MNWGAPGYVPGLFGGMGLKTGHEEGRITQNARHFGSAGKPYGKAPQ